MELDPGQATRLLSLAKNGDGAAWQSLLSSLGRTLRTLAEQELGRERAGHTLQPTALIHEAWLRVAGNQPQAWESRGHFLAIASRAMRQVLIDHHRIRDAAKRGGGALKVTLSQAFLPDADELEREEQERALAALHEALEEMSATPQLERKARTVDLLFFAGYTIAETAVALEISEATVSRDWQFAKAWLYRDLETRLAP